MAEYVGHDVTTAPMLPGTHGVSHTWPDLLQIHRVAQPDDDEL